MKLDATPFARKRMKDDDRALVRLATPEDHTAIVSHNPSSGFVVRIVTPRPATNVGESRGFATFKGALTHALRDMHTRAVA